MKRKVNRVGQNTLTVSLPAAWVRKHGLKAGDELEVHEDGKKLIVAGSLRLPKKEVTISIPKVSDFLLRFLCMPYVKGYDVINVRYEERGVYDKVMQSSRMLMGFEIVENTDRSCKLVNISTKLEQNFEILLSRLFTSGITFSKELFARLKSMSGAEINALREYEFNANRISLFCRRAIQTGNINGFIYSPTTLYSLVGHLEEFVDCFRDIVDSVSGSKVKVGKEMESLFEDCINMQEISFKIFNRLVKGSDVFAQLDLFKEHKKLRQRARNVSRTFKGDKLSNHICGKLLSAVEISHHINEELFY